MKLLSRFIRAEFIELLFMPYWKKNKWSPLFWAKLYCESFYMIPSPPPPPTRGLYLKKYWHAFHSSFLPFYVWVNIFPITKKKFDTKGVIRRQKLKDRQYNGPKKKMYKTLHRRLKIEQHEPQKNHGWTQEGLSVPAPHVTLCESTMSYHRFYIDLQGWTILCLLKSISFQRNLQLL